MTKKEKLKILQKLSEEELTKDFLIPLYESEGMEFKSVRYTHKKLEFGKDIVYCEEDRYGDRIYTAVQVKKTKIASKDTDRIAHQINEAFGEPFTYLSDGKKKNIDRVVVLTSNEFLEEAKESLRADLRGSRLDKLVKFVDIHQIVKLLDKHLPSAFWEEYDHFNRYFKSMKKDFETIKDISAIGQKEPVPLENIYVSLKLTEEDGKRRGRFDTKHKLFEIEKDFVKKELEEQKTKETIIDADRAVRDFNKLVIVGVPGSGKTTLLRHFALKSCMENLEKQERVCVPVPITLRAFSESGKCLREYIDEVFKKYKFPNAKDTVEKDLKNGKCRILLDGFDELATKDLQTEITEKIHAFSNKYHKCRIMVTSRIAGYNDDLKGFTKLELMEFDDSQIKKFIKNWFEKTDPVKAKSMSQVVMGSEQTKAIARNPLMIAIIAIIYEEDKALPQKRAALYNRCVDVLLGRWDKQKKIENKYTLEQKEFFLKKLAFYGHSNNKRTMTEKEIIDEMQKHLPTIRLKEKDAKPFLDEIWKRSYLLRQIAMDRYDFLHLSFQEYFTALELKEQEDGISSIIEHINEPWWQEPTLLYAGISKDATTLIKRINNEVPEDIFYSNLMLFGKCVADADFTTPELREGIIDNLWSLYQNPELFYLREKAINVLALIKPEKLVESLIEKLADKKSDVRGRAAYALESIGSEKAVEPLLNALTTDKKSDVRGRAAYALGSIGSEKAVESLLNALTTDKKSDVRESAAYALGSIGSEKAVEPLLNALTTAKESDVRRSAAYALGEIGSEKAVEPLLNALTTAKESDVRGRAAYALGEIGSEKAVEPLLNALTTAKESDVRGRAAYALGRMGSEKAVEPLLKALTADKKSDVRRSAAYALGIMRSEKAVEPLLNALTTAKESDVRESAAYALGIMRSEKAVEPLLNALTTAKESDVRESAAYALGIMGSEKAVEPLLKALTTDEESYVRSNAAFALEKISKKTGKRIVLEDKKMNLQLKI